MSRVSRLPTLARHRAARLSRAVVDLETRAAFVAETAEDVTRIVEQARAHIEGLRARRLEAATAMFDRLETFAEQLSAETAAKLRALAADRLAKAQVAAEDAAAFRAQLTRDVEAILTSEFR